MFWHLLVLDHQHAQDLPLCHTWFCFKQKVFVAKKNANIFSLIRWYFSKFPTRSREIARKYERWIMMTSSKWKHFTRYWSFVRGIPRSPVNSPHKGQWQGVLMFSLICARINGWVNNREAGDLRRHRTHYDVTVMDFTSPCELEKGVHVCVSSWHVDQTSPCRPQGCKSNERLKVQVSWGRATKALLMYEF